MSFVFILTVIVHVTMFLLLVGMLRLKKRTADRIAKASAFSVFLLLLPATMPLGAFLFTYSLLYFLMTTQRITPHLRLFIFTAIFYFASMTGFSGSGLSDPIVNLNFFNYHLYIPFQMVSDMRLFSNETFVILAQKYVSATGLYFSDNSAGLALLICAVYMYIFLDLAGRWAPRAQKAPEISDIRAPALIILPVLAAYAVTRIASEDSFLPQYSHSLFSILAALMAIQGLGFLYSAIGSNRLSKLYVFILFGMCVLVKEIFWVIAAAGVADRLFGLRVFFAATAHEPQRQPRPRWSPWRPHIAALIALLLLFAAASSFIARRQAATGASAALNTPAAQLPANLDEFSFEDAGGEVHVISPALDFYIDRYEYPNRAGEKPMSNVWVDRAAEYCAAEGKHLCTPTEWAAACRSGADDMIFYVARDTFKADAVLRNVCAWKRNQIARSGSFPDCRNPAGVYDMVGNLWEWVDLSGHEGMVGIMGPGAASGCKMCNQCDWIAFFFEGQYDRLPTADIGFRCCR